MAELSRFRIDTTKGPYWSDATDEDLTHFFEFAQEAFKSDDGGFFTVEENGTKTVINVAHIVAITVEEVSNEPPF